MDLCSPEGSPEKKVKVEDSPHSKEMKEMMRDSEVMEAKNKLTRAEIERDALAQQQQQHALAQQQGAQRRALHSSLQTGLPPAVRNLNGAVDAAGPVHNTHEQFGDKKMDAQHDAPAAATPAHHTHEQGGSRKRARQAPSGLAHHTYEQGESSKGGGVRFKSSNNHNNVEELVEDPMTFQEMARKCDANHLSQCLLDAIPRGEVVYSPTLIDGGHIVFDCKKGNGLSSAQRRCAAGTRCYDPRHLLGGNRSDLISVIMHPQAYDSRYHKHKSSHGPRPEPKWELQSKAVFYHPQCVSLAFEKGSPVATFNSNLHDPTDVAAFQLVSSWWKGEAAPVGRRGPVFLLSNYLQMQVSQWETMSADLQASFYHLVADAENVE